MIPHACTDGGLDAVDGYRVACEFQHVDDATWMLKMYEVQYCGMVVSAVGRHSRRQR